MSLGSAWIRWESRCRNMPAHGVTAGDTYYLGLRDYVEMYPCPNGLPIDYRKPSDVPLWNERVARAKRDIETHKSEQRVQVMVAALRPSVVKAFLRALNNGES